MQLGHEVGLATVQLNAQQICQKVVIAIPAPREVQGDHEQVLALDGLQHRRRIRVMQHGVAQCAVESAQYRCSQQESPPLLGLAVQYLGHQVIRDVTVVSIERFDNRVGVGSPAERQRGQIQPCRPPLGASIQQLDVIVCKAQVQDGVE